jgi:hypothetical protein
MAGRFEYEFSVHTYKWVKQLLIHFGLWLEDNYTIDHKIVVKVFPAGYLYTSDDVNILALGYFRARGFRARGWPSTSKRKKAIIDIASHYPFWKSDGWIDNKVEACVSLLGTFAHEFVHYERWRDGGSETHRGLPQRANAIRSKYISEELRFIRRILKVWDIRRKQ